MKAHIPNLLTLLNLACGTAAVVLALEGQGNWSVYLLLAAALLDFLDGFMARLLKAYSETGKQLDSLADMVSFGVLPGVYIYLILKSSVPGSWDLFPASAELWIRNAILISVLLVPAFSAIRLARFNLEKPGSFFSGLPTPAHALFWTGIFWQFQQSGSLYGSSLNMFFLWAIMLIMAIHLILPIPMYSLKFQHFRLRGNLVRYLILLLALVILLLSGLSGLPVIILSYILLSLLNLLLGKRVRV